MSDTIIKQLAGDFLHLMPLLKKNIFRPFEKTPKDLSPLQLHVLFFLNGKEPLTMSELATGMHIIKQQLTSLTNKLEENKLIERVHDKKDRRSVKISITKAGLEALDEHHKQITDLLISKFEQLSNEDIIELKTALQSMYNILNQL